MAAISIYGEIARLRWPMAGPIFGAGQFAILSRCPEKPFLTLYETALEAKQQLHASCGHAFCKGEHTLFDLAKQPAPALVVQFKKKPHWFYDLERD